MPWLNNNMEKGYVALGYDKFFHDHAPVWATHAPTMAVIGQEATVWVHEGIEVEADRRVLIYYVTDEGKYELDMEVRSVVR